jgi:hypothetical protein
MDQVPMQAIEEKQRRERNESAKNGELSKIAERARGSM